MKGDFGRAEGTAEGGTQHYCFLFEGFALGDVVGPVGEGSQVWHLLVGHEAGLCAHREAEDAGGVGATAERFSLGTFSFHLLLKAV